MTKPFLRTIDIARELGVHVNTVRLYEENGYLSPVPRGKNGYRYFTPLHLEQARLAHLTISYPYVGDKTRLIDLVQRAARGDLGMAMELAYQYLAQIRVERTYAEAAIEFLERWATGQVIDTSPPNMHIGEAAVHLDVSVDMLRNWERNGLISIPRDPATGYRVYGSVEFGRLRVIRMLLKSGFSLMAILRMLNRFDAGATHELREALDMPLDESINDQIEIIADHWLASLLELEERAQAVIRQISTMISQFGTP